MWSDLKTIGHPSNNHDNKPKTKKTYHLRVANVLTDVDIESTTVQQIVCIILFILLICTSKKRGSRFVSCPSQLTQPSSNSSGTSAPATFALDLAALNGWLDQMMTRAWSLVKSVPTVAAAAATSAWASAMENAALEPQQMGCHGIRGQLLQS